VIPANQHCSNLQNRASHVGAARIALDQLK